MNSIQCLTERGVPRSIDRGSAQLCIFRWSDPKWHYRINGQNLLSEREKRKTIRFQFQRDKTRYTVTHTLLRILLARYFHISPLSLKIRFPSMHQPVIERPLKPDIQFSISYSGDYSMIGLTHGKSIGVDLEVIQPVPDWQMLSSIYFHPEERKFVQDLPQKLQVSRFLTLWTRKEAVLKCAGIGLKSSLDNFSVIGDFSETEWTGVTIPDFPDKSFQVRSFTPLDGFTGSAAFTENEKELAIQLLSPGDL